MFATIIGRFLTALVVSSAPVMASRAVASPPPGGTTDSHTKWAVFYAPTAATEAFAPFDLVVLESETRVNIPALQRAGKKVLGYLSLGEVGTPRSYFQAVKEEKLLLAENPNWKGSFMVDVRNPKWTHRVLESLIPEIRGRGFDGIFVDTLDNPPFLEEQDPTRFHGMGDAAVELIRSIRKRFPNMTIMVNRGYSILDRLVPLVDVVLGESVYTTYDFATGKYQLATSQHYDQSVTILRSAKRVNPLIKIFTLDYWNPDDIPGRRRIYETQRRNGFDPYVATVALDRIVAPVK